jgi:Fe-S oxidoreductase
VRLVLILGLVMNAVALPIAGRRIWFLYRLISSGQPAHDRVEGVTKRTGTAIKTQLVEVFGQRKLLKWTLPGAAHFFVFWAFVILATVYLEAYGSLFHPGFAIPFVGHWAVLGFLQDFIAVMALLGIITFALIRLRNSPARLGRQSRFKGSHLDGAWITLFMIFNVLWSMFLFRGASVNTGRLPYGNGAFMSHAVGWLLSGLGEHTNEVLEGVGLLIHIGVMLTFLIFVLNSKHLHIFVAPLNVMFKRQPSALGAVKPLMVGGEPIDFENIEDLDEDASLGVGKIEDFSWKGMLDFTTCTECGRCQSQCPAWNTEKPLSPKLLIMNLRDHAMAKAPYLLTDEAGRESLSDSVKAEAERELVGATEGDPAIPTGGAVIDPDVLWSCTSCGACVQQCPVDIEHVDHIIDMRRYQVLIESSFPSELNGLFKGLENKGNPWNMSPSARMDWAKDLPFEVKQVGTDVESLDEVDWLFWVGCAGAYEDRAKKTTRAVAELLDMAGVSFAVLGDGETCTGDPARRAGNEFVFQQLAMQNAEVFKETKVKKVVSTCAHCFNTLKNEYSQFGVELEVVHHTQLLNRLVREGRLTPVAEPAMASGTNGSAPAKRSITYHDPCYLGRHNQVYSPPRELLAVIPGAELKEMPRNSERSFCCGAGGARMWMEEKIGERINVNRTTEAVATGADQIAIGCPFCRVMLSDGLTALQAGGEAREEVEVLDVSQMLLAAVKRDPDPAAVAAEPSPGDATQSADTVTEQDDVGADAAAREDIDPEVEASGTPSYKSDAEVEAGAATGPGGGPDAPDTTGSITGKTTAAQADENERDEHGPEGTLF